MSRPPLTLSGIVLGTDDVRTLSEFYLRLLGWELEQDELPHWRKLRSPQGGTGLSFQLEDGHVRPVWPAPNPAAGDQQMQIHLDIQVEDLDTGEQWARECGAERHAFQPQDDVRVMIDPSGHPFCLFLH
ncbi:VOC family protein [Kineosporia succinea]|uniref:Catechol 2,3-dioxygenase-like lactoylglutathione lyase family enzyme n=1 Tax=Kineosporia succinea TaxID=84632 RepID=A0ABT9NWQ3_9ACTN|nr:VOC family protein [Kineosporia succinea]MDP9824861.1 catechol 2,3-dioxygenase-like lactoylglutathione lyase family enzyme [Kineosporia succinea]